MQSVRDILGLWPTYTALGAELGVPGDTVRKWAAKGFVPAHVWPALIAAAAQRGMTLTPAQLLALMPPRKQRAKRRRKPSPRKSSPRKRRAATGGAVLTETRP